MPCFRPRLLHDSEFLGGLLFPRPSPAWPLSWNVTWFCRGTVLSQRGSVGTSAENRSLISTRAPVASWTEGNALHNAADAYKVEQMKAHRWLARTTSVLCAGCRSSCLLQAQTQTRRIFSGSPRRATCDGFFRGGGAVQLNLQFPSGRHVVGNEDILNLLHSVSMSTVVKASSPESPRCVKSTSKLGTLRE